MTNTTEFWSGESGDAYIDRQPNIQLIASYTAMWAEILSKTQGIKKAIEFGANVGNNLHAIERLLPSASLYAVETNRQACLSLIADGFHTTQTAIQQWDPRGEQWDLVFTRGVLIHIPPEDLPAIYEKMYHASSKYIVVAEYYNPTPVEIEYQGQQGLLWKRDFAGEMMRMFPGLRLVGYEFFYRGDANFAQDDVTAFVLEKA